MAENDQKDKTVEKVTGEVENTDKKENNEDRYEKVCFICHRPESVTGKMIDLPNNICVCPDCMQKSFDAMNNMNFGGMDYSQFMNMGPMMGFGDMDAQIPKSQRVKKKKPEEEKEPEPAISKLEMAVGETVELKSDNTSGDINWGSTDSSIIAVSKGGTAMGLNTGTVWVAGIPADGSSMILYQITVQLYYFSNMLCKKYQN